MQRGSWLPHVPGRTQDEPKGEPLLYFPKALAGWLRVIKAFWQIEKMETKKGHMTHLKKRPKTVGTRIQVFWLLTQWPLP